MISIVVAVYNIEALLHYCVESVLGQDSADWELILVNDGSKDNSGVLCENYASSDPRIKYVFKENGGLSSARNAGIKAANGDWIIFVDGDDYLLPDTISTLKELIEQSDKTIDLIQYGYREVTDYNSFTTIDKGNTSIEVVKNRVEMFDRLLDIGGEAASGCTKLLKTSIAKTLLFKEGIIHEDEEFTTRLLLNIKAVVYTDFKPYIYVRRKNSITTSSFSEKRLDIIKIMIDRIEMLNHHGLKDTANKVRLKLILNLDTMYMAASAAHKRETCVEISHNLKKQLSLLDKSNISLSRFKTYKYRLLKLGFPILRIESMVRGLLNKQIRYE